VLFSFLHDVEHGRAASAVRPTATMCLQRPPPAERLHVHLYPRSCRRPKARRGTRRCPQRSRDVAAQNVELADVTVDKERGPPWNVPRPASCRRSEPSKETLAAAALVTIPGVQWRRCSPSARTRSSLSCICSHDRLARTSAQQNRTPWLSFGLKRSMRSKACWAAAKSPRRQRLSP